MKILAWPIESPSYNVDALQRMAEIHKQRKEWTIVTKYCKEALAGVPRAIEDLVGRGDVRFTGPQEEGQLLMLLADAAEGQGDMRLAHEYDEMAKTIWLNSGQESQLALMPCYRREAVELLAAGKSHEAVQVLKLAPRAYITFWDLSEFNLMTSTIMQPIIAAIKVLADVLVQTRTVENAIFARKIWADVEETEAILTSYRDEVLEEARRELMGQARAAATPETAVEEEATTKKSKAAKRKQQKRRAQQKKKAAEMAEAAAATTNVRGEEVKKGQGEQVAPAQKEEEQEGIEEQEEQEVGEKEEDIKEAVTSVTAAVTAVAVSKEEGEKEECSVCLNAIESEDVNNPAGPPLVCGHRYHAFCLHYWVKKCRSKCIEATCPYCRAPVQEMESS